MKKLSFFHTPIFLFTSSISDIHSYRKFSRNQSKEGISMSSIETFLQMVKESDNIVFFGGAGVSTESGIPDFRSVDGLYNQKYDYPPETILSHSFYVI